MEQRLSVRPVETDAPRAVLLGAVAAVKAEVLTHSWVARGGEGCLQISNSNSFSTKEGKPSF